MGKEPLESLVEIKAAQGFRYLAPTFSALAPVDKDCFLPPDKASIEERWEMNLARDFEAADLVKQYGNGNVWLGPQISDKPVFQELTPSEQRGFWIRDLSNSVEQIEAQFS